MNQPACRCECPRVPVTVPQTVPFMVVHADSHAPELILPPFFNWVLILATIALALQGTWKRRRSVLSLDDTEGRPAPGHAWMLQLSPAEHQFLATARESVQTFCRRLKAGPVRTSPVVAREVGPRGRQGIIRSVEALWPS